MSLDVYAAVRAELETLGWPVPLGDATGVRPPYLLLWGPGVSSDPAGGSYAAPDGRIEARVTCVGRTPSESLAMSGRVQGILTPGLTIGRIVTDDLYIEVEHTDSRPLTIERQVTGESTNTHPSAVVELFDLHVQHI